ncbi:hypothetical protein DL96DRAFT_38147 [Flagelloscypha sp. PMI_526]|nr:hypothetical protein DL96DRAFT_38147 [Flagelloscypha sp. PMI_526]
MVLNQYLYRTIDFIQIRNDSQGTYLKSLIRNVLTTRSPEWLAKNVRHLYIPYGAGLHASLWESINILARCPNITRLALWFDAHEDIHLRRAMNELPRLKMLECNVKHLVFLLDSDPIWMFQLTHLFLLVWDNRLGWPGASDHSVLLQRLSISKLKSLQFVAFKSRIPDLFCCRILRTAPPSMIALVVLHNDLDVELRTGVDPGKAETAFFDVFFPNSKEDKRLVFFFELNDSKLVDTSTRVLNERALFPVQQPSETEFPSPLDDWAQAPHSGDGTDLSLWKWAKQAVQDGKKLFTRPIPEYQ